MRVFANLETGMVSIERLKEYSEVESEADWTSTYAIKPKSEWPNEGKIEFFNFSTAYRKDLDPVLKNITLTLKPKEKVGIVGRTGAGKSSFAISLFRIIEPTGNEA